MRIWPCSGADSIWAWRDNFPTGACLCPVEPAHSLRHLPSAAITPAPQGTRARLRAQHVGNIIYDGAIFLKFRLETS